MKITEEKVAYIADLANLRLTAEEVHRMAHDLDEILTHVEKLNEINTDAVEPMAQVLSERSETVAFREDVEVEPLGASNAVANAAVSGNGYFKVPRVIER